MRSVLVVILLAGVCTGALGQANAAPEGAWMRFDPAEEYHGLSYDSRAETESRVQYIEVEGCWCIATENEAGQYYIDLVPEANAIPPGSDILSVTIEYLDNGTGPIVLQYRSEEMVSTPGGWQFIAAPEIWRRNTRTWKRHTWQIRDAAFANLVGGTRQFRLSSEGFGPTDRDLCVSFVGISRECLWLDAEPAALAADGQSISHVTITGRGAQGQPLPDGTEVRLHAARGTAPQTVTLTGGQTTFDFRASNRAGTGAVIAVLGERVERCPIFLLAGQGTPQLQTRRFKPAEIADAVKVSGEAVAGSSVSLATDPDGTPYVEVRVQFEAIAQGAPAAEITCPLEIDGVPERLALEVGGDGSADWFMTTLEDMYGERFVYTFWPMGQGAIQGWRRVELQAKARAYACERPGDGVIDLPAAFPHLRVWFQPGCREGVFRLRCVEVDMLRLAGQ
jgi:hypothetical protein